MIKKTEIITVKYMRETDKNVRLRYLGGMLWFPKKVLVGWDDEKHWYYNEELTLEVQSWYLKKLK